ncbi:hypothetical protein Glove_197g34 [Diversispora epigaea]|uniref:Protein kinase domain-containing protein n=1 Tax=Diversispora epigaea TaxID=1348612 RepID=A0A397IKA5_9GLOM|nr:hypothetical protein Glove_197g34 [Diversispora epigaea]
MSITLLCLVEGNTFEDAFPIKIDRDQLVGYLKEAIKAKKQIEFAGVDANKLMLWKVEIPDDREDQLKNLSLQDQDKLLTTRDVEDYWTEKPPKKHIHIIVRLPLLSLEEALSCIPSPVTYSPKCTKSKTTTKVNGDPSTSVMLWRDFFDEVNRFRFDQKRRFQRPQFIQGKRVVYEEDVRVAFDVNICLVLNQLIGPELDFSRLSSHTPGIPDFNCHHLGESLILVIEVKRKHVLEGIDGMIFSEFYKVNEKAKMVIQQIYNYMGVNELRYEFPPVLKAYAYLALQAKENPKSPHHLVPVPTFGNNNSHTLRSHLKLSSNSSLNQPQTSGTLANQQLSSRTPVNQQDFSFTDFKFKNILGEGRSGKTLLCEFHGDTIALKSTDLSKAPSYVLKEMQKEVEIYKDLIDIQGKYIPRLVCYGYYGGGMSFVIGMTIVGTILSKHKIVGWQKSKALKALEAIHEHGILHNDIREENILINNDDNVYLIDFGMACWADLKKKRKLFSEEQFKLSRLLNCYIM